MSIEQLNYNATSTHKTLQHVLIPTRRPSIHCQLHYKPRL